MKRRFTAKKDTFSSHFKNLHLSIYNHQMLNVNKTTNSMKVIAELKRKPLKINIETQMFK